MSSTFRIMNEVNPADYYNGPADPVDDGAYLTADVWFWLSLSMPVFILFTCSMICTACYFRGRAKGNDPEALVSTHETYKQMKKSDKTGCMYMIYNLGFQRGRKMVYDDGKALRDFQIKSKVQRKHAKKAEKKFRRQKTMVMEDRRTQWRSSIDMIPADFLEKIKQMVEDKDPKVETATASRAVREARLARAPGELMESGEPIKIDLQNGFTLDWHGRSKNDNMEQINSNLYGDASANQYVEPENPYCYQYQTPGPVDTV